MIIGNLRGAAYVVPTFIIAQISLIPTLPIADLLRQIIGLMRNLTADVEKVVRACL